jgi:hypothetical protein
MDEFLWPDIDHQFVLNELRKISGFYSTFKKWDKLDSKQRNKVKVFFQNLDKDTKKKIIQESVTQYENAEAVKKQKFMV